MKKYGKNFMRSICGLLCVGFLLAGASCSMDGPAESDVNSDRTASSSDFEASLGTLSTTAPTDHSGGTKTTATTTGHTEAVGTSQTTSKGTSSTSTRLTKPTQDAVLDKGGIVLKDKEKAIYIAPNGNDDNDGSFNKPLATFDAARKKLRQINKNMQGNIYIVFRGGEYTEAIKMSPADSGNNGYQVVLKSYPGEQAVIYGGKSVSGWTKVSGKPYYKVKLSGIESVRQLYINGEAQPRSSSVSRITALEWLNGEEERDGYVVNTADLEGISAADGLELRFNYQWHDTHLPISSVKRVDSTRSALVIAEPAATHNKLFTQNSAIGAGALSEKFVLENAVELIDEPGEWAFRPSTDELYYYPAEGIDLSKDVAEIPSLETLMSIEGFGADQKVSGVTVEGLHFRLGAWNRVSEKGYVSWQADTLWEHAAVYPAISYSMMAGNIVLNYVDDICMVNNTFSNMGGVVISAHVGITNSIIEGNAFYQCAAGGITIGKHSAPNALEACTQITFNNNALYHMGQSYSSTIPVMLYYGEKIQVSNNDIAYCPYSAINIGWGSWGGNRSAVNSEQIVSGNRIMNCVQKAHDGGAIYTLDDHPNSVIYNNYIKNVNVSDVGLYHDEGSKNFYDYNNVVDVMASCFWTTTWVDTISDITYKNNYASTKRYYKIGKNVKESGTTYVLDKNWPLAARDIMLNKSGVSTAYGYLRAIALGLPEAKLSAWYAADSQVTTDSAKKVSAWVDMSGNSQTAISEGAAPIWSGYAFNEMHAIQFDTKSALKVNTGITSDAFSVAFVATANEKMDYAALLTALGLNVSAKPTNQSGSVSQEQASSYIYVCSGEKGVLYCNGVSVATWNNGAPSIKKTVVCGKKALSLFEIQYYDVSLTAAERENILSYHDETYAVATPMQNNLLLWLKADALITTENGKVTAWGDSGRRRTGGLVQTNSDNMPTYVQNAINGLPAVRFDGKNDFLANYNTRWLGEEVTMFFVYKPTKSTGHTISARSNDEAFSWTIAENGSVSLKSAEKTVTIPKGTISFEKAQLMIYQREPSFDGLSPLTRDWKKVLAKIRFWTNNTLAGEFDTSCEGSYTIAYWNGLQLGTSTTATLDGDVAEVLIYNRNLSETDRQAIATYLIEKYALT